MTVFDQLFFNSFDHYKKSTYKKNANTIAVYYITLVQASLVLVLGVFFAEFLNKMHVVTMSSAKAWTLFVVVSIVLYFKNWIRYGGKKRRVLNALPRRKTDYSIWTLWLIPVAALLLSVLFLKIF